MAATKNVPLLRWTRILLPILCVAGIACAVGKLRILPVLLFVYGACFGAEMARYAVLRALTSWINEAMAAWKAETGIAPLRAVEWFAYQRCWHLLAELRERDLRLPAVRLEEFVKKSTETTPAPAPDAGRYVN